MKIISIDIGIVNFAICLIQDTPNNEQIKVIAWNIFDLTTNGYENNNNKYPDQLVPLVPTYIPPVCHQCTKRATYFYKDENENLENLTFLCTAHAKKDGRRKVPSKEQCVMIRSLPLKKKPELVVLSKTHGTAYKNLKRDEMVKILQSHMNTIWYEKVQTPTKPKPANRVESSTMISRAFHLKGYLDAWIERNRNQLFSSDDMIYIIIENQLGPNAVKMMEIQGMVVQYFTICHVGEIHCVSSSHKLKQFDKDVVEGGEVEKKTEGKEKTGSEVKRTYNERKAVGIQHCLRLLDSEWTSWFSTHAKQDDLSDCFLQGVWYLRLNKNNN
jgi:hypothetical protein